MSEVPDILRRIVRRRRRRLGLAVEGPLPLPPVPEPAAGVLDPRSQPFLAAVARPGVSIVAEVKLGSPRLGDLRERVDPVAQARAYAEAGARALSVVVEPDFFHGSYELLARCREAAGLPTLAKDFIVDGSQIESAADAGADAVLLIAALLEPVELVAYAGLARARGLVPLVETHGEEDLDRLAGAEWELVGVNNRDLRTFEVDVERAVRMRSRLPAGCASVAESGLSRRADVESLSAAGYDAFLIGEALLLDDDPAARLRHLLGTGGGES